MSARFKTYFGERTPSGCIVTVNGRPLPARLNWWAHSPTGFEWGYGGSGPAQLALAILGDHLGVEARDRAIRLHQQFKFRVVAKLPREGWTLTSDDVARVVAEIAADHDQRVFV